jgi:hypothetical protein
MMRPSPVEPGEETAGNLDPFVVAGMCPVGAEQRAMCVPLITTCEDSLPVRRRPRVFGTAGAVLEAALLAGELAHLLGDVSPIGLRAL